MATRKTRLVIAFVLMLSLVSFFSIPASVFADEDIGAAKFHPLTLKKTVDQEKVLFKDTVVKYTFAISNNLDAAMNGVILSDPKINLNLTLPDIAGKSTFTTDVSINLGSVSWDRNEFENTATATYNLVRPTSLDSELGAETSPTQYTASDSVTVEYCPPLTIVKEVGKNDNNHEFNSSYTVNFKDSIVKYEIKVKNNLYKDLQNVSLMDSLIGLNFVIPEIGHHHNNNTYTTTVAFNLGTHPENWVDNMFINTASASVDCTLPDQTTKNAIVTDTATVNYVPPLVLEKTVDPLIVNFKDSHVEYNFKITNNLNEDLVNLILSDPLIGVSIPIDKIKAGKHTHISVNFDLANLVGNPWVNDLFVNTATVTAPFMQNQVSTTLEAIDTATLTYVPPLTLEKSVLPTTVFFKDGEVAYTFLVTNNLTKGDIKDVVLYDSPIGTQIDIGTIHKGSSYTTTVAFDLGDLADESWVANQYVNTATVVGFCARPNDDFTFKESSVQVLCEVINTTLTAVDTAVVTFDPTTVTINKDVPNVEGSTELFSFDIYNIIQVPVEIPNDQVGARQIETTDSSVFVATVPASELAPYTIELTPGSVYTIIETPMAGYTTSEASITFTLVPGQDRSVIFTNTKDVVETGTTTTTTRRSTTTIVPEPTPAGPVITPEVVLDEQVPAAPLPKTGGLDPGFLYGLGALLATGGLVIRKRKDK